MSEFRWRLACIALSERTVTVIARIRTVLTGFPGGPGVATMYSVNNATLAASVRAFWLAAGSYMAGGVTIQVEGGGDLLESTTGVLTGAWSGATPAVVTSPNSGVYSAPSGAVVDWLSPTILDGRRVRGRTFVVPLIGSTYEGNGTLSPSTVTGLKAAGDNLVIAESGGLCVWHRPRKARAANGTIPAVTARLGGHALITTCRVPDIAAVLRSRRD